ncbi:MAG: GIY-YIG nuclease family protein [Flavobacteriales bacterium]|nr:GIY-YIG nuclease family protein [Flavobacteriales bacterium]
MMALYVYILRCADNSYYTGLTDDPMRRLEQHQQGLRRDAYTFTRRPVEMVYAQHFPDGTHDQARAWEKKLKGWSRAKKEAVIKERWNDLPSLAECKNESHHRNKSIEGPSSPPFDSSIASRSAECRFAIAQGRRVDRD